MRNRIASAISSGLAIRCKRDPRPQPFHPPCVTRAPLVDIRLRNARRDRVHSHPSACELLRQSRLSGIDCSLGGGVPDIFAPAAQAGGHRRDVDDGAAEAAWLRESRRAASRATQIAPSTLTSMQDRSVAASALSSLPDLPVMPALLTTCETGPRAACASSNTRTTSASTATSPRQITAAAPPARQVCGNSFGRLALGTIVDRDIVAPGRRELRQRRAYAAASSCNKHDGTFRRHRGAFAMNGKSST